MNVFGLFRRGGHPAPPRPIPPQPEAERDWTAGDLAKCVAPKGMRWQTVNGERPPAAEPTRGQIRRVRDVHVSEGILWLSFEGLTPYCFPAGHFKKLRPCSADFMEQVRGRSPVRVGRALEPVL